ncbi:penicillin acylase family protein [Sediminivirga luteola]|uniref:Penicillin amidase n=1 Tax=Sediminivirga luteola TaxID=1774748 RepID=A0A8J2TZL6_9MICO|nr:penicillin acylase family protein [Sediminivirga luteola]GGA21567.1 penicillin amidase [Sediminivirga luteola]
MTSDFTPDDPAGAVDHPDTGPAGDPAGDAGPTRGPAGTIGPAGHIDPALPAESAQDAEFPVPDLDEPVEVIVDRWGVPHIYASSARDGFLAQGFNAARDRLFQIDLWLRRGNGRLAEVLGEAYLEQDRANRLFRYRGGIEAEWASYAAGTREAVEAFATGVNAYISWACEEPGRLPPEFHLHGYRPRLWSAEDYVRFRTHGLFYNAEQELARSITLREFGTEAEAIRQAREPADPLQVPEGTDLQVFSEEVLRVYRLAFSPVAFAGEPEPGRAGETLSGSNNWVVSGERTSTGRPVLANDPHRAVTLPSLRYLAHLSTPAFDVVGAGEPGLPGISIGHNDAIAFGLTIWPADQEDLFVYETRPGDGGQYRYRGEWTPFEEHTEEIGIAGGKTAAVTLRFTRHGPVIYEDTGRGVAVALKAAWLEPGMVPYLASLGYMNARNADDFLAALRHWGAPGVNQIYATPDGDFGWQPAARIPRRKGWDGSVPVPGDGRYEWDGWWDLADFPSLRRPDQGWFASANEMNLPAGHDNTEQTVTYDWYSYARATRLREWLGGSGGISVEESAAMQWDDLSVHAVELLRVLDVEGATPRHEEFRRLRAWDGRTQAASREALVFEVWARRHLRPRLVETVLGIQGLSPQAIEEAKRYLLKDESFGGDLRGDLRMAALLGQYDPQALRNVVEHTLPAALEEIRGLLGEDTASWSWGAVHHTALEHPAFTGRTGIPAEWARLGPVPRGGTGDTVGLAGYDGTFRQTIGSSFRMALDVGDWDRSLTMNAPGQSGDPRSRHYADQFGPWLRGETFPLVYSRQAVEDNAGFRFTLMPGAR